jgi:HlyD family secretion protein
VRDAELTLERSERALTAARADRTDTERSLTNTVTDATQRLQRARDGAAEAAAKLDLTTRLSDVGGASPRELADARSAHAGALEEVGTAERALATARSDLDTRTARAERDLADAVAALEQARLRLERAEAALAGATLVTPIDGIVSSVGVAAGGFAGSNATVLTVADDRRLELVAQVDETEISQIAVGQSASVTITALGNRTVPATVAVIAPGAHTSQNIPVFEIVLGIDNPDGGLRPGMTGEAEVVVRREPDTVTLPTAAVTRGPRGDGFVTVLHGDGAPERRPVEVVATVGTTIVVRGDLPAGTRVEVPAANAVAFTPNAAPGLLQQNQFLPGARPGGAPGAGRGGFGQ